MASNEEKYNKLKELLEDNPKWPRVYVYKFIVRNLSGKVAEVKQHFESAEISENISRNGNFVSISIKEMVTNADHVIQKYKSMENINGLISL